MSKDDATVRPEQSAEINRFPRVTLAALSASGFVLLLAEVDRRPLVAGAGKSCEQRTGQPRHRYLDLILDSLMAHSMTALPGPSPTGEEINGRWSDVTTFRTMRGLISENPGKARPRRPNTLATPRIFGKLSG